MVFGLGGVSPRGAGLLLSSLANDAFFIGALVKGWGEFSHGLYCCEQSDSAFSSHHPFEYHHTSGFSREESNAVHGTGFAGVRG